MYAVVSVSGSVFRIRFTPKSGYRKSRRYLVKATAMQIILPLGAFNWNREKSKVMIHSNIARVTLMSVESGKNARM